MLFIKKNSLLTTVAIGFSLLSACGFDPTSEEFDRVRFGELQKTDCPTMATLGTKKVIVGKKNKETYDSILARCQKLQSMSFEQYRDVARVARETGEWDLGLPPPAEPTNNTTTVTTAQETPSK
jgi:hypothetical protein